MNKSNNNELSAETEADSNSNAQNQHVSQPNANTNVSSSRFQSAYAQYWDMVKDVVDSDGWVYSKELPNILDAYFEGNTGKPIEFQKSFGPSGDNPHWLTKGSRWRPKELSDCC